MNQLWLQHELTGLLFTVFHSGPFLQALRIISEDEAVCRQNKMCAWGWDDWHARIAWFSHWNLRVRSCFLSHFLVFTNVYQFSFVSFFTCGLLGEKNRESTSYVWQSGALRFVKKSEEVFIRWLRVQAEFWASRTMNYKKPRDFCSLAQSPDQTQSIPHYEH